MKKTCILLLLCLLPVAALAEIGDIPCINGNCEGWSGTYENKNDVTAIFRLYNNTGKPAFNITYRLMFYTFLDEFVAKIQKKVEGPITKSTSTSDRWPEKADKVKFEIYADDKP